MGLFKTFWREFIAAFRAERRGGEAAAASRRRTDELRRELEEEKEIAFAADRIREAVISSLRSALSNDPQAREAVERADSRATTSTRCSRKVQSSSSDRPGCAPGWRRLNTPFMKFLPESSHSPRFSIRNGGLKPASSWRRGFPLVVASA